MTPFVNLEGMWEVIVKTFNTIIAQLDLMYQVKLMVGMFAAYLPPSSGDVLRMADYVLKTLDYFLPYIRFLDFFMDIHFFLGVIAIILPIEGALLFVRGWRLIRSFVT
jgi:hypothetical protein